MYDLKIEGLEELIAQSERVDQALGEELAEGLGAAAKRVAADTASDTPVRTGRAKAGLQGHDGRVTATGAEAIIVSTGTPSAYFHASEREILDHDAAEAANEEAAAAMTRALAKAFK